MEQKTLNKQIAIDGPAGAGKSTTAKKVAAALDLFYVDTGAMYRTLTYKALQNKIPLHDEERVTQMAKATEVALNHSRAGTVWCDGEDVTSLLRSPEISRGVSVVAAYAGVRERLVELQRREAERGGVVMDGRDIGTKVLPEASLKIFLTATLQERARRRWEELSRDGKAVEMEEVVLDMETRDRKDTERKLSPLKPAEDAIILDTTGISVDEIVAQIVTLAREAD